MVDGRLDVVYVQQLGLYESSALWLPEVPHYTSSHFVLVGDMSFS